MTKIGNQSFWTVSKYGKVGTSCPVSRWRRGVAWWLVCCGARKEWHQQHPTLQCVLLYTASPAFVSAQLFRRAVLPHRTVLDRLPVGSCSAGTSARYSAGWHPVQTLHNFLNCRFLANLYTEFLHDSLIVPVASLRV